MITDLASLADVLLSNFRTIHIAPPTSAQSTAGGPLALGKANFAARRAAQAYRDRIRRELCEHGSRRFLDHLEADHRGEWRVHIFATDEAALAYLDRIEECEAGDPVTFNPEEFVRGRLPDCPWADELR